MDAHEQWPESCAYILGRARIEQCVARRRVTEGGAHERQLARGDAPEDKRDDRRAIGGRRARRLALVMEAERARLPVEIDRAECAQRVDTDDAVDARRQHNRLRNDAAFDACAPPAAAARQLCGRAGLQAEELADGAGDEAVGGARVDQ